MSASCEVRPLHHTWQKRSKAQPHHWRGKYDHVTPETGLREAALLMIENKIAGLPVASQAGDVVGIITESDLFEVLVQQLDRESVAV